MPDEPSGFLFCYRWLGSAVVTLPATQSTSALASRPINSGFVDQGTFALYVNEDRVALMEGKLSADGSLENNATLTISGLSVHLSTKITADKNGEWQKIESQSPVGMVTMERDGQQVRIIAKGKTQSAKLKPGAILFDNYSPMLMSFAVRAYDRAKGGKQEFPLLIVPGAMVGGSLEFKGTVEKSIAGKDLKLNKFDYELPGVTVSVLADDAGKIYLGDVPSQHAAYVRQGYEALRIVEADDPLISKPTYKINVSATSASPCGMGRIWQLISIARKGTASFRSSFRARLTTAC